MHQLIRDHFAPQFGMKDLNDSAIVQTGALCNSLPEGCRLAFTTDSYVVSPLFFPGGNIGDLAVYGTVNDLSVVGAKPFVLSAGFIIEEGFAMGDLRRVLSSMAGAARRAGVRIVTGDTKVVERGKGDGVFINTCGIGAVAEGVDLGPERIRAGDKVVISGSIGNHGVAVISERNGLAFDPPVLSDTAPLNGLVETMFSRTREIRVMRDPTRGGVATTLKEFSTVADCCIAIHEDAIPLSGGVRGACELLGLDPLYVANEGILIAVVSASDADGLVGEMKAHPLGRESAVIGEVTTDDPRTRGMVLLRTAIGGTRVIDMLSGEQLPRIC